ncbi:MAG: AzlC family ABC transporter permease [Rhodobacteraceae bacterium]|nr:AzlC family ABC transporter permease [Paracoccaceae bacterium]
MAQLPLQLGVVPFGLVFGVLGIASGLSAAQTILMSSIIFGGASQVVFAQLWSIGASPMVTGGSVAIINLRHIIYSASISRYITELSLRWRLILGYLLTDEAFAVSFQEFENKNKFAHFHLLGGGLTLWIFWQISTIAGVFLGTKIPSGFNLEFAIPLTFIAIILPKLRSLAHLGAAITASFIAIFGQYLPNNLWIILAVIIGMVVGGYIGKGKFQ